MYWKGVLFMITKVHSFFNQKILIIIFIFCIFIVCFSLMKNTSNKIIFSEVEIYQDINVESIMNTCEKFDVAVYYPITKNKKVNRELKSFVEKYVNKLEYDAMYYIPTNLYDKLNLQIEYKVEKANKDIVSFIFKINYSQGKSFISSDIFTMTYNLDSGKRLYLNNFFDEKTNYINELCEISKAYLISINDIDKKIINWFIDDINTSFQYSFDGYSFSSSYLTVYFNSNKISSNLSNVFEVKIPWESIKHLLLNNVYTASTSDAAAVHASNMHNNEGEISQTGSPLYFPAFNINVTNADKVVALTFDDGPHYIYTDKLLKHIGQKKIVATFFVLGNRIEYNKDLLNQMVELGCEIGNHTLSHKNLTIISNNEIKNEIESVNNSIKSITGYDVRAVRPPYGRSNARVKNIINKPIVLWSVDPEDWKYKDAAKVRDNVLSKVNNGSIILMHDIYQTSVDAAIMVIDELLEQGYKFVTVSQLLELEDQSKNGIVFTHK